MTLKWIRRKILDVIISQKITQALGEPKIFLFFVYFLSQPTAVPLDNSATAPFLMR